MILANILIALGILQLAAAVVMLVAMLRGERPEARAEAGEGKL